MKIPFNQEIADVVCEMIANNNSLVSICNLDYMPEFSTIMEWLHDESPNCQKFKRMYDFALNCRTDYLLDEVIEIADDDSDDEFIDRFGNIKENKEFVNRSKLRVDARLRVIEKINPKKYGKNPAIDNSDRDKLKTLIEVIAKGPAN